MHKSTLIVLLSLCFVLVTGDAEARNTKKSTSTATTTAASSERIESHQAAPAEHHGGMTFDLGVSSVSAVMTNGGIGGSITGILHFTSLDALQLLAGISQTNGGFGFGVGGLYKRTVLGNESAGFHIGGGLGLGTVGGLGAAANGSSTSFAMNIAALAGVHFDVPGTQVAIHLDGGPVFSLISVSGQNGVGGTTVTNFAMGPLSSILGASAVYQF